MGTAKAEPHFYVYRLLFQAQICGTVNPVDLSLERLTIRFSVSRQSMSVFSNTYERTVLCSKSFTPYVAVGMYTKTLFAQLKTWLLPTKTIAFQPIQKVSVSCYPGFWQTTVRTFVWNPRGKHWIPVYNILEGDCKIVLTHHKYVIWYNKS